MGCNFVGRAHTLALTNTGDVYSLGNNAYGQCGRNIVENEDYFSCQVIHKIEFQEKSDGDKIVDILCGMDHRFVHCAIIFILIYLDR